MRPPILWIALAFGAGLWAGLASLVGWETAVLLIGAAALLHRRAPLAAALGLVAVAGIAWGAAALRERAATCAGRWSAE
ncbi:MAG: hypothetical protein ACREMJ_05670, partial [Gemmatimonadales bacterium]